MAEESNKPTEPSFDQMLVKFLGEFGKYQKFVYFIVCLVSIPSAMHMFGHVFLAANPNYWCHVDTCTGAKDDPNNACYDSEDYWACEKALVNYSAPSGDDRECKKYENITCLDWTFGGDNSGQLFDSTLAQCNDWDYDFYQYKSSIVTDFNLVCDDAYLATLASSLYMCGVLVGAISGGQLADRLGRKTTLLLAIILQVVFGIFTAFSVNYVMFVIGRFFVGLSANAMFLLAFVIGTEIVGPSKRTMAGIVIELYFATGYMVIALLAFLIRDWRTLQLAISVPSIFLLSFYWLIPESARWLLTQENKKDREKADKIIRKIAKVNKVDLPENIYNIDNYTHNEDDKKEKKINNIEMKSINNVKNNLDLENNPTANTENINYTMVDLFKHSNMRKKTLNLYYCWFTTSFVYYGLSLNTSNLGGDDYINAFISGAVEVPAYIVAWLIIDIPMIGRKVSLAASLMLAGIFCIITPFPKGDLNWLAITFSMIGKFGVSAAFAIVYIFSAELYPTPVRSVGMGSSSMWARVGSILAPFLILIGESWEPLPYFVFGATSVLAGLLTFLLPETLGQELPETLEEGERFGKKIKDVKSYSTKKYDQDEGYSNSGFVSAEENTHDKNNI